MLAFLSTDSILLWVIKTHGYRRRYRAVFDGYDWPNLHKIEFRHLREAETYLGTLC